MIRIRKYVSEDQPLLIELLRENTPKYFSESEEHDFITYLNTEIEDYFVVELNKVIVGCGGINYEEKKAKSIISWDIISSNHQGVGIGSSLLQHRLDVIKANELIKTVIVRTSQHVFPFYEKHGFDLKYTKEDYWEKGFDLYYMELKKEI